MTLRIAQGAGPLDSDIRVPTFAGDAFISSQARALLENLTASRGDPAERRTLGTAGVEAWLERFISRDVSGAVNRIRDTAREIAKPLGLEPQFQQLDAIIGALLGTRTARLTARAAIARAAGRPYDDARLTLFQTLAEELQRRRRNGVSCHCAPSYAFKAIAAICACSKGLGTPCNNTRVPSRS